MPAKEPGDYLAVEMFLRKPLDADGLKAKVAELPGWFSPATEKTAP